MPAGQQPAQQPVMKHKQHEFAARVEHHGCAGDVPGSELAARERVFRFDQHHERQFFALGGQFISVAVEPLDPGSDFQFLLTE